MKIRLFLQDNRGQAIVESALVLPVLVLVLLAVCEFGQVFNQYLVVTAAAREGARAAAVSDEAAARTAVTDAAASIGSADVVTNITYPGGKRVQGQPVSVSVSKPLTVSTPVIKEIIDSAFAPDPPAVAARSVMRVEQP